MISQNAMEGENQESKHSDFSIEHILNRAGANTAKKSDQEVTRNYNTTDSFSWLQCTRYCPPKVPRVHKKDGPQKRQLGRHPRIPFTTQQLSILEQKFKQSPYLSSEEVTNMSKELHLADIRVKIWFQNRRARERRERNSSSVVSNTSNSVEQRTNIQCSSNAIEIDRLTVPLDFSNSDSSADTKSMFSSQNSFVNSSNSGAFIPIMFPFVSISNSLIKEERR